MSKLTRAGFQDSEIEPTRVIYDRGRERVSYELGGEGDRIAAAMDGKFARAFIRALKPTTRILAVGERHESGHLGAPIAH